MYLKIFLEIGLKGWILFAAPADSHDFFFFKSFVNVTHLQCFY